MEITGYDNIIMANSHPGEGILRALNYVANLWPKMIVESCDDMATESFRRISMSQVRRTVFQDMFNLAFYKDTQQIKKQESKGFFLEGDSGPFTIMFELYSEDRDRHELPFTRVPCHFCMHGFYEMTMITPVQANQNKFFSTILNMIMMLPPKEI
jgi:hypothetical protein